MFGTTGKTGVVNLLVRTFPFGVGAVPDLRTGH
jgi:hypothetical protein